MDGERIIWRKKKIAQNKQNDTNRDREARPPTRIPPVSGELFLRNSRNASNSRRQNVKLKNNDLAKWRTYTLNPKITSAVVMISVVRLNKLTIKTWCVYVYYVAMVSSDKSTMIPQSQSHTGTENIALTIIFQTPLLGAHLQAIWIMHVYH